MLKTLSIVNYALIENLEIEFEEGFSVITGETGAGKSIILGALSLILGTRADYTVIRDNSKKCIVEGVFNSEKLNLEILFSENDLDYESQTIIRREILPSGKSRAFVNDTPVNLSFLNNLGNRLINIHSQNETLQLSNASFQLNVLDDYINKPTLLEEYRTLFDNFTKLKNRLNNLEDKNNKAVQDEDYIRFQLDELGNVELESEAILELENRAKYLEHSEEIKIALSSAASILNNENASLLDGISDLESIIAKIQTYLPEDNDLSNRLGSVNIELKDIFSDIEILNSNDDFNPAELQQVNEKLGVIYSLMHKHRVQTGSELLALKNEFEDRLLRLDSLEDEIIRVKEELSEVKAGLKNAATQLHTIRAEQRTNFSKAILKVVTKLGMKDAGFLVKIEELPDFTPTGIDRVQFMFNANHGMKPGEISKIASGGELSRLMLAVKSMINHEQVLPTVIFDEIDSGVSGKIASKVGDIIRIMSNKHQIISITHLPQIASKADIHYKAVKLIEGNSTISKIEKLNNEERVEELAGMLSSEKITSTALDVARELMDN